MFKHQALLADQQGLVLGYLNLKQRGGESPG
ncbi:hypothetical protein DFQ00_11924 [Paenibacillus barcinonensis]|uniref:Uncharacterized protein n=1 Tax=Paenibacillus barcinonensis TaxID=198119 RepID=A0A2V4UZ46_PAEBA|nr:hypothetical protein DFQ00_11924 [Paenibacillus barcinonensis]